MRGIEYHRGSALAHDRQTAHVRNQVVVAKGSAALANHDRIDTGSGIPGFGDDVLHVARGEELSFLDIHRLAGGGNGLDEIGLATEKGWRLQHIDDSGNGGDVRFAMYVGQDRSTDLTPHFREDVQTAVDPWTTRRLPGAAIGLVIGGLEDVRQRKPGTDLLQPSGNLDAQIQRLRSARAGDQEQWLIESGFEVAELHTFAR
ncbi:MAG: hypothetical protein AW09_003874 [Candidatus Accumulibacter phosphatis]|uniref:Uncharacterized protein n=1 Tax=Candidatus Accumulibacter phosphatis TaxID=327160 RepID=A0A080M1E7_9PROT|nr:MAG: hypothetical protein AW09_003874 [Candidatus Accumulibacter phosphatis]